jgi:hypothetical protein
VTAIHADIDALTEFRAALTRFRYAQREVADRGGDAVEATRASLEAKASRWRARLEQGQAELTACRDRAAAADDTPVDCSGYARAVSEAGERLEHIRHWQQRIDDQVIEFHGATSRFKNLLETDLPRAEEQLAAIIASLHATRRVQPPGSLSVSPVYPVSPGPDRPDRDGDQQLRLLDDAWGKAVPFWQDDIARQFGAHHWLPLRDESRLYLEALRAVMDVLDAAERDTE